MKDSRAVKRIVVLVSGRGSNLEALIAAIKAGSVNAKIVGVISDRTDAIALEKAKHEKIAASVIDVQTTTSAEGLENALTAATRNYRPDLILLAGFMRILSPSFVGNFEGRIMNIHPSLLPAYKGLDTHRRVLEAGEAFHGCSVHFVTAKLDDGPLIIQARVAVNKDDDSQSLAARVLVQEHRIYPHAVALFCEDRIKMQNGRCLLDNKVLEQPLSLD